MTKNTKEQKPPKAYLEAYACDDHGDGPQFAMVLATPDFMAQLRKLADLCKTHSLSEVRAYAGPELWGPGDVADDLRFNCAELAVTSDTFWFADQPKHANYHVETRSHDIENFCQVVSMAEAGSAIYFGADHDALREQVEEAEAAV